MTFPRDEFEARGRSLENAFFQKADAQLLNKLRSELAAVEQANGLAKMSGITDQKVLHDLVHVGVTAESLLAMRFVPMIQVAWSDRRISAAEQAAILKAAEADNVVIYSPAYHMLRNWLERPPDAAVYTAWKDYVRELARAMPAESLQALRERTKTLCYQVAKATGGVLGVGSISQAEQQAIDDCINAWN